MSQFIICEPRGVSRGLERFPSLHEAPFVKAWRCELTALSQRHNFYFVACNDSIHVYCPSFPDQIIPAAPELVIRPPTSQDQQPDWYHHGIDPEHPHSITRVLVDYLGNDEILLVTCDDGDVIGYRIQEIRKALESKSKANTQNLSAEEIKTFFHRNVGASAWGIAVHREARIIAFSANTFKITVIAFGLAEQTDEAHSSSESDCSDISPESKFDEERRGFPSQRTRDHVFTVAANTNIPSIAFNNTGKDPEGRWLFSSSIDGKTMLFDLHSKKLCSVLQLGWCASARRPDRSPLSDNWACSCEDRLSVLHAAWGAIFLDTRSAHDISSEQLDLERQNEAPYFEDANKQKQRFKLTRNSNNNLEHSDPGTPLSITDESDNDSVNPEDSDSGNTEDPGNPSGDMMSADSNEEDDSSDDGQAQSNHQVGEVGAPFNVQDDNGYFHTRVLRRRQPYFDCEIVHRPRVTNADIQLPFLVITKDDIFLVQRPPSSDPRCAPGSTYPYLVTAMRLPLHPRLQGQGSDNLKPYDRHCFSAQVPELGIFIIASPVGRAAIFSFTRYRLSPSDEDTTYGFKMEYMLPFVNGKEEEICVPASTGARLAGIAVGPVQGMLDKPAESPTNEDAYDARAYGEGKWRLLMYYTDHTVVSYEIARKRKDGGLGLGDIVV